MTRIAITDLYKLRKTIEKATLEGKLSEKFTIEHLQISIPQERFTGAILQKMRIYGLIDKIYRVGKLTTYSLSDKYSRKNNSRKNLFK